MNTLLLRLAGPMQAWGVESRFTVRDTAREPSKSGVVGLLAAALGRRRNVPCNDLASLRFGVRVDREGQLRKDFHTAGKDGYYVVSGGVKRKNLVVTNRYYLADTAFLAGLEGELELLKQLNSALRDPHWPLFLGRKAFVPSPPVWLPDGLREGESLTEALTDYPWLGRDGEPRPEKLRVMLDDSQGAEVRPDTPLSFDKRRFAPRRMRTEFVPTPTEHREGP